MSIAEVETSARPLPGVYERARRRQVSKFKTRDAAVTYLAPGRAHSCHGTAALRSSTRTRDAEWPVAVPAYRYARGHLARIAAEHNEVGLPSPAGVAYHHMLHALRAVLSEDSVFPTMSIDEEGGVIAEWLLADFALEVDVDPDGQLSYTVRRKGQRVGGGHSQTPLRKMIRDVSAVVSQVNPNWRSLFQHASAPIVR